MQLINKGGKGGSRISMDKYSESAARRRLLVILSKTVSVE